MVVLQLFGVYLTRVCFLYFFLHSGHSSIHMLSIRACCGRKHGLAGEYTDGRLLADCISSQSGEI